MLKQFNDFFNIIFVIEISFYIILVWFFVYIVAICPDVKLMNRLFWFFLTIGIIVIIISIVIMIFIVSIQVYFESIQL